jgi:hypothetical protein
MSEDKEKASGILDQWKWLIDVVKPKIKEFLLSKMTDLDKKVLESPNKIDDAAWGFLRGAIVNWINAL